MILGVEGQFQKADLQGDVTFKIKIKICFHCAGSEANFALVCSIELHFNRVTISLGQYNFPLVCLMVRVIDSDDGQLRKKERKHT